MKLLDHNQIAKIHDEIMDSEPGLVCEYSLDKIDSIVGRIQNIITYDETFNPDVFNIAALYAEAIAVGHAFPDGNKRTAFVVSMTILQLNDIFPSTIQTALDALKESESVQYPTELLVLLAEKKINRKHLANVYSMLVFIGAAGFGVFTIVDIIKKLMK
ncbi:hypothetical protein BEL05_04860 [Shewanella colwelliana]|uniref:Fido domain-containing protein n=1 Tax=Shewanella colwelliana TaxID=23 RepID=A0A1E5IP45_SHECO|nr:type II toxin-antitoxin system death-on-curing family toxin [Shewanella colwelliana]OEG72311.1 hypothetical protein BEL05_04860 [Shewanella colwelliana]